MDHKRLQLFFDLSMSLLVTADATTGRFVDLNPAWETTLGWSLEELKSRPFVEFIHPEDLAPTNALITDMVERNLPAVNFENRYKHKDGRWIWLSWVGVVRGNMFYSSARDVTRYRATVASLEAANEELRHFGYAASHDLREPLRTIQGHVAHIDSTQLPPDSRRSFEFVVDAARHMHDMLDAILDYSQIEERGRPPTEAALSDTLDDAIVALDSAISGTGAKVERTGEWPALRIDRAQIAAVFQNLLHNAIKYRKKDEAPHIVVSSRPEFGRWVFEVSDNGVGFPPERAPRAFQIFQRLHARSKYPGLGVGLAQVKRTVRRHGGEVGIDSERGVGTRVWFSLPK